MQINGKCNAGRIRLHQSGQERQLREHAVEVGDRVAYNAALLAEVAAGRINLTRGQVKHARGYVTQIVQVMSKMRFAKVRWEGRTGDATVNCDNLIHIGEDE